MPGNLKIIALFFLTSILLFLDAMPMNHGKERASACIRRMAVQGAAWGADAPKTVGWGAGVPGAVC